MGNGKMMAAPEHDRRSVRCDGGEMGDMDGDRTWSGEFSAMVVAVGAIAVLLVLPPVLDVIERRSVPLGLLLVAVVVVMIGAVLARRTAERRWEPVVYACLVALAVTAVLVTLQLGAAWRNVWLLLAIGIGAVILPTMRALLLVMAATVGSGLAVVASSADTDPAWSLMLTVFLSGASNIVLSRLLSTIRELRMTRQELALRAVADERERFSRDLHDLLGHTLSLVVVKAEAVRRLVGTDQEAAADHARDIESIGRRALSEVREAVEGYRNTSLAAEVDRGRRALEAAGVDADLRMSPTLLPETVDQALAWVVREGVTNVIRHSGAARCRLSIDLIDDAARLELVDDGRATHDPDPHGGTGLIGLRERLATVDGDLVASRTGEGFRLVATVPAARVKEMS